MTDEGVRGEPMDAVEMVNTMVNLASGARAFFNQLVEEGFEKNDALRLTAAWIAGLSGGKVA